VTVAISAIEGCGGVGKTALAVRVCHELAAEFPDGQLFVDLRGFDPALPPLTVQEALIQLLWALGMDVKTLSDDADELAGLYRTVVAGKRVLILLDNAVSSDQVVRLLPGTEGCLTVVTSRNRLAGLVARHGARRLNLDVLSSAEAAALLDRLLGADRVAAEPEAAGQLAELCGRFPLALRILSERLSGFEQQSLAEAVRELRVEQDRLDLLSTEEDPAAAMRAVFSWSYQALKPEPQRLFRLLALHPGPELSAEAAAALDGRPRPETRRALDVLTGAHLLEHRPQHRYRLHDLLRLYAGELTTAIDDPADRDAATDRLVDFYLRSTHQAVSRIRPDVIAATAALDPPEPGSQPMDFADLVAGLAWLGTEQANLPLVVEHAAGLGRHRTTWQLVDRLYPLYEWYRTSHEWLRIATLGLQSALACGDRYAEGRMRFRRGRGLTDLAEPDGALSELARARALLTEVGDANDVGSVLTLIGLVHSDVLGQFEQAAEDNLLAMRQCAAGGNQDLYALALSNLANCTLMLGDYEHSIELGRTALALHEEQDNPARSANTRGIIAEAELKAGRPEAALPLFAELLDTSAHLLSKYGTISSLTDRATCHRLLGDYPRALADATRAAEVAGEGFPAFRADALFEMGHTYLDLGDPERTRQLWQQALDILQPLNHPHTATIRTELEQLSSEPAWSAAQTHPVTTS
jgi:tetratricopeptide (TPR) repeat protein